MILILQLGLVGPLVGEAVEALVVGEAVGALVVGEAVGALVVGDAVGALLLLFLLLLSSTLELPPANRKLSSALAFKWGCPAFMVS